MEVRKTEKEREREERERGEREKEREGMINNLRMKMKRCLLKAVMNEIGRASCRERVSSPV